MINDKTLSRLVDISCSLIHDIESDSKHVSFIVRKNKILSFGVNKSLKTHPIANKLNYRFGTIHSELSAILRAKKSAEFKNVTLVNLRLSALTIRTGIPVFRNSMPCPSCVKLIMANPEIKQVVYTNDEGWVLND
jgi:deoxycytidylate deaminase